MKRILTSSDDDVNLFNGLRELVVKTHCDVDVSSCSTLCLSAVCTVERI
jgi:hypothetical protein